MEKVKIGKHNYILSKETPKYKDCYVCVITDSTSIRLSTGVRLETDNTVGSHTKCIKILATDNKGLNLEGCPTLKGFIL